MSGAPNFLDEAYVQLQAGNLQEARQILDLLVNDDPMNVEAWEAYMQTSESCEELDDLCERAIQFPDLAQTERTSILDYHCFLRQRIRVCNEKAEAPEVILFELRDQFTYTFDHRSSAALTDPRNKKDFERQIARFLGKAILIPYCVLLTTGIKLLSAGNNFGYWIILMLAITILIGRWNMILHVAEIDMKPRVPPLEFISTRQDIIASQPKLVA